MNQIKVGDKVKLKKGLDSYRYFTEPLSFYTYSGGIYEVSTHAIYTVWGVGTDDTEPYVLVEEHSYFLHPDDLEKVG